MNDRVQTLTGPARSEIVPNRSASRSIWVHAALFLICLCGGLDWLTARTHRLYVDEHANAARQAGTVWQHFGIRGHRVVPEIISRDDGRFVFPVDLRAEHQLTFKARPQGGVASYQIYLRRGDERRLLASETLSKSRTRTISVPRGIGELEFSEHGSLAWFDLRLVRSVFLWPVYLLAFLAFAVMTVRLVRAQKMLIAEWLILLLAVLFFLAIAEAVLRVFALKLPPVIIAARSEFGLVGPDTRWIDPARYKLRLRPNLNTYGEWRYGDLVRLGVIPKEVSPGTVHRYAFQTDAEGFRNAAVRDKIDIAAIGDSFTDAANTLATDAWPSRLEELSGRAVQNYGTSGFGPQQELYVLRDYALKHKPRWTVLGFFAGNDIYDAEVFDHWEQGLDRAGEELTGWKLRDSFRRYQTSYLWTISALAVDSIVRSVHPRAAAEARPPVNGSGPRFDRGMFTIPVANRTLRYAFLPPYLQKLGTPAAEIERSRGWELTRAALRQMKADCDRDGSSFVLMFIPAKAAVYWPLTERSFAPAPLQDAVNFYCRYNHMPLPVEDVRANRLAQNALLQAFCAQEKIPMLDLTPSLEHEVEAGREMYFPDDTHWNARGHDLAARELAKFLDLQP
jgi:SGNH hydrolase-like domain, acetyltransferase AlgX